MAAERYISTEAILLALQRGQPVKIKIGTTTFVIDEVFGNANFHVSEKKLKKAKVTLR